MSTTEEKKLPWGLILVVIFIIVAAIVGILTDGFGLFGSKESSQAMSHADSTALALQQQISELETQTGNLAKKNEELNNRNGKLSNAVNNLSKKLKDMTATPVVTTGNTETKTVPVTEPSVSAPVSSGVAGFFEEKYYEAGQLIGCIRLGGKENRYWISLAVMSGKSFNDVKLNDQGGHNFIINGTSTLGSNKWGVTPDGTFYIEAEDIDAYLIPADNSLVEVKASFTYWIPKLLTRQKVGGKLIYTYKFTEK